MKRNSLSKLQTNSSKRPITFSNKTPKETLESPLVESCYFLNKTAFASPTNPKAVSVLIELTRKYSIVTG